MKNEYHNLLEKEVLDYLDNLLGGGQTTKTNATHIQEQFSINNKSANEFLTKWIKTRKALKR